MIKKPNVPVIKIDDEKPRTVLPAKKKEETGSGGSYHIARLLTQYREMIIERMKRLGVNSGMFEIRSHKYSCESKGCWDIHVWGRATAPAGQVDFSFKAKSLDRGRNWEIKDTTEW